MPRLSLWRPNHSNDYRFFDKRISEMFTVGGTDMNVHKYLGPINQGSSDDATQPSYLNQSAMNIQDLLFLENRDRKYDSSIYTMRGIYRINDNDFDLSQFGLFLTSDTLFILFHLNDMVETLGRKIIPGDVLELPHLKDYYPLNDDLPAALKRYYVVQDATRGAEGFSPTWWGHLWRVKVQPLVDSQEYKDILNIIKVPDDPTAPGANPLGDLLSTYNTYLNINDAIVTQAETNVPESGYDISHIYTESIKEDGRPSVNDSTLDTSTTEDTTGISGNVAGTGNASDQYVSPPDIVHGYLTGDGKAPNGMDVKAGIAFPMTPYLGEYFLRIDCSPNRLFRYDGNRWVKIEDAVRTSLTPGKNDKTLRGSFINNPNKTGVNDIAKDVIRCTTPYTPPSGSITSLFDMTTKTVVTTIVYSRGYGVVTSLNSFPLENTVANITGNIGFTITANIPIVSGDRLEYTVYKETINERQSLSNALRPQADN